MFGSMFSQMLVLFVIIGVGYIVTRAKVFDKNTNRHLANLLINVTCPATVLYAVLNGEHVLSIKELFVLTAIAAGFYFFLVFVAYLMPKILRIPREDAGLYRFMTVFSNVAFVGFPLVRAVYGPDALFYVAIFNMMFQLFVYTYGVNQITTRPEDKMHGWRIFCQPVLIASILGYIFYITDFQAPGFVLSVLGLLDQLTSPVSMLVIGCALALVPLKQVFTCWRMYPFVVIRQILVPLICYLLLKPFIANQFVLGLVTIISMMPVANIAAAMSAKYDGNQSLAATGIFISTLFSVIAIPLMMYLLFPG